MDFLLRNSLINALIDTFQEKTLFPYVVSSIDSSDCLQTDSNLKN